MLRTYKGRYEGGKFILPEIEQGLIPDSANIIVTILDEDNKKDDKHIRQVKAVKKFLTEVQESKNELTDEEWKEFENLRSKTNLTREVEKWFTP